MIETVTDRIRALEPGVIKHFPDIKVDTARVTASRISTLSKRKLIYVTKNAKPRKGSYIGRCA